MSRNLVCVDVPEQPGAGGDEALRLLAEVLAANGIRACFRMPAALLEAVLACGSPRLVGGLQQHDLALRVVPGQVPDAALLRTGRTLLEVLGAPALVVCGPPEHFPELVPAAAETGFRGILGAPFEGEADGRPLGICDLPCLCDHAGLSGFLGEAEDSATAAASLQAARQQVARDAYFAAVLPDTWLQLVGEAGADTPARQQLDRLASAIHEHIGRRQARLADLPAPPAFRVFDRAALLALAGELHLLAPPPQQAGVPLTPAEVLSLLAQAVAAKGRFGEIGAALPLALRPPRCGEAPTEPIATDAETLRESCRELLPELVQGRCVPDTLVVGGWCTCPSAFLTTLRSAVVHGDADLKVPAGPLPLLGATRKAVRRAVERYGDTPARRRRLIALAWAARPL